jgi:hypothetical protein
MAEPKDPNSIIVVTTQRVNNMGHTTMDLVTAHGISRTAGSLIPTLLETIREKAALLGADAVVALTVTMSMHDPLNTQIVLAGTAVRLPWPNGSADPELHTENPTD